MAQGVERKVAKTKSVLNAWKKKDERAAIEACIEKYAAVIDATDSARDMKPLVTGMFDAIDRLNAIDAIEAGRSAENPLGSIIDEAERIIADG